MVLAKELTAVIPTLLKDENMLKNLLDSLCLDNSVKEIIVINNTTDDFEHPNPKVRIISEGKNLYVNPSWNLGVREAKTDYVALINDDLVIPDNICSVILEKMDDSIGIAGIDASSVIETKDVDNNVILDANSVKLDNAKNISFKPITFRPQKFGVFMLFKKSNYVEIPDELKIFWGDDWIIYQARKLGKTNITVNGIKIIHLGSLSSKAFKTWANNEKRLYLNNILPAYKRILGKITTCTHDMWFILGFILSIPKKK